MASSSPMDRDADMGYFPGYRNTPYGYSSSPDGMLNANVLGRMKCHRCGKLWKQCAEMNALEPDCRCLMEDMRKAYPQYDIRNDFKVPLK